MYHLHIIIMCLLGLFGSKELQYSDFEKWVDTSLSVDLPDGIQAFCFNLYEDGDSNWSAEIVGAGPFDKDDSDWACDEVFSNRKNPIRWKSRRPWEKQLSSFKSVVEIYLKQGKYATLFREKKGLGLGFVDGDLTLIPIK
ncbi:MAG: hypothetical protein J6Y78_06510 [Paludibacteraceae bacterium]|nr:hypothetical protein [Paludibacteraceae bacterium]